MTFKPLTVEDGVIGAEDGTPAEHAAQRRRAEQATDEMRAFSLRMYQEAEAAVARALGTTGLQEAFDPTQPRWPKGHAQAGKWRPKLSSAAAVGGTALEDAIKPIRDQLAQMTDKGWVALTSPAQLQALGQRIDWTAQHHSTVPAYTERRYALEDQWAKLDEERYNAARRAESELESFLADPDATVDRAGRPLGSPERDAERDRLLNATGALSEKLVAVQREITQLKRDEERAHRDAVVGVLAQIRPMGGRLTTSVEMHPSSSHFPRQAQTAAEIQIRDAMRMFPTAWIDDMNRSGTAIFEVHEDTIRADHRAVPNYIDHSDDVAMKHFVKPDGTLDFDAQAQRSREYMERYGATMREQVGADSVIRVSITTPPRTFLHEIMHRVQSTASSHTVGKLRSGEPTSAVRHRAEYNLLTQRGGPTSGGTRAQVAELAQKLDDIYPGHGYEDYETTIPDEWMHAYYGKVYGHYAEPVNELLPMATEDVFYSPTELRRKDPETFRWILGLLVSA